MTTAYVPQTIVLVDDLPAEHESLAALLEVGRVSNPLVTLYGRKDLLAYLDDAKHPPPDILMVDLHLKDGDGVECIQRIAEHPFTREHTAIIAVTAFRTPEKDRQAELAGADAIIEKPLTADVIMTALKQINGFRWMIVRPHNLRRNASELLITSGD